MKEESLSSFPSFNFKEMERELEKENEEDEVLSNPLEKPPSSHLMERKWKKEEEERAYDVAVLE